MSRLASQTKMGFYPTPSTVVNDITSIIALNSGARILDPCCGKGDALAYIKTMYPATTTYGVELDANRYQLAKEKLDHVLNCDSIGELRATNDAFDVLFENPPYDTDMKDIDGTTIRLEKKFLTNHLRYLKSEGGLLILIIPIKSVEIVKGFLTKLKDLRIFAFPEDEYLYFKQVVITGVTTRFSGKQNYDKNSLLIDKVINNTDHKHAYRDLETTSNAVLNGVLYNITDDKREELKTFHTSRINPDDAVMDLMKLSGLYEQLNNNLSLVNRSKVITPLTELTEGHLAMLIASGMVNGLIETHDGEQLVLKGYVKEGMYVDIEASDDTKEVSRKTYQININALDLNTGSLWRIQ